MAEKTLEDVIKALKANNLDQTARADQNYAATLSVAQEVAVLTTLLKKHFIAQKAAEGDRLEKERETSRKFVGIDRSRTDNRKTIGSNNQMNFAGMGGAFAGLGVGMGAAGAGLGAFFLALGGAESIMEKFGTGDNLRKLMVNLGAGLASFSDRDLKAMGALFAGSALFTAMPGLGGGDIVVGLGAVGIGIAGFFSALGAADMAITEMESTGEGLKTFLENFAAGIGALNNDQLIAVGGLLAGSAAFGAVFGIGKSAKAAAGMAAVGVGIAAFFAAIAGGDKSIQWMNSNGESIKTVMMNFGEAVSAFDQKTLDVLTALGGVGVLAGLFPGGKTAVAGGFAAIGLGIGAFFTGIAAGDAGVKVIGKLTGDEPGKGFKQLLTNTAEGIKAFEDIKFDDNLGSGLEGISSALMSFFGSDLMKTFNETIKPFQDGFLGFVDFLFNTDYKAAANRTPIEALIDGLEPMKTLDNEIITNMDRLSGSLDRFFVSFKNIADMEMGTSFATRIAETMMDVGRALRILPILINGGKLQDDDANWLSNLVGTRQTGFGQGLKNLKTEDLDILRKGVEGLYEALAPVSIPAQTAPSLTGAVPQGYGVTALDASDRRLIQMATERNAIVAAETSATDSVHDTY